MKSTNPILSFFGVLLKALCCERGSFIPTLQTICQIRLIISRGHYPKWGRLVHSMGVRGVGLLRSADKYEDGAMMLEMGDGKFVLFNVSGLYDRMGKVGWFAVEAGFVRLCDFTNNCVRE